MIKISCIIPCYNQGQYMQDAISSIKVQTYRDYEIICVIDGAKDESKEIAMRDADIVVDLKKNYGVAKALNAGFRKAQGEFICVLSQDDMIEPTYFEQAIKSGADIFTSDIQYFGDKNEYVRIPAKWDEIKKNNQIHGSSVFRKVCEWDEKAEHYCDWKMWVTLADKKLHYEPKPLLLVRIHEGQISNNPRPDLDEYIRQSTT
jgi:glycosyltransferase involved in cell wall biosynthesis